ncbi:hypothetical protein ACFV4F_19285 [Kitasatospora sp. NPDC059722]|uniref:hypothetical protein n=1 Tax=Kitasatospora sp. NPDC059722 TaxID=3346925 RepID=UPI0036D19A79
MTTAPRTGVPQITAAGALLTILSEHAALPEPHARLDLVAIGWDEPAEWGVELVLQDDMGGFEQWREALDIAPADVDSDRTDFTAWLVAHTVRSGVPVTLVVHFDLPDPDEGEQP